MANDSTIGPKSAALGAGAATQTKTAADEAKKSAAMGEQEFLMLLINQLQHQDPLDPLKSEEFAVQLAQFSSLEQLIKINQTLSGEGDTSVGSMASFLGNEIVLKDGPVQIANGEGPNVNFKIPPGTQSARIDLVSDTGQVAKSITVSDFNPGDKTVKLEGLRIPNGEYTVRTVAVSREGKFVDLDSKLTGIVEGFVLEPEPALLVGGGQVGLADVVEVRAKTQSGGES